MTRCWDYNPEVRPTFNELCQDLGDWMKADNSFMDISQLNEDQPYYDECTVSVPCGASYQEHVYDSPPWFTHVTQIIRRGMIYFKLKN